MLQFAGFWMALATFLGIWWGHVGVRWLEARIVRIGPAIAVLTLLGLALNIYSLFANSLTLSGVASIVGITLLWDAFEVHRQAQRVEHGHAPANPDNPRHAAILATSKHATTEDLLDREPQALPQTTVQRREAVEDLEEVVS
jgi:apolipoprotein N-acyltransferase